MDVKSEDQVAADRWQHRHADEQCEAEAHETWSRPSFPVDEGTASETTTRSQACITVKSMWFDSGWGD